MIAPVFQARYKVLIFQWIRGQNRPRRKRRMMTRRQTAAFGRIERHRRQKTCVRGAIIAASGLLTFYQRETVMRLRTALLGSRAALLFMIATCSTLSLAAPAPYYLWQGKHKTVCAQTSPGKGWTKVSGGFVKSDCSI